MERSGNFYKAIQLGYILISILIGCMAYNSLYEWQEIEALELGNKKIDELRKEINNINIQMIKFSLLGETILEWNDKESGIIVIIPRNFCPATFWQNLQIPLPKNKTDMKKTIDLDFSDMLKTCLRFARVRVRIISEIIERWTGNMKGLLKFSGILPPPSCSDS